MAISTGRQLLLLLWKNWLLQKRRIVLTIFQILLPALFALILLLIRTRVSSTFYANNTIWDTFPADTSLPPNLIVPPQNLSPPFNFRPWSLAYAPNSLIFTSIANNTAQMLAGKNSSFPRMTLGRGFASEAEMEAFFADANASYTTLGGLVFDQRSSSDGQSLVRGKTIAYKLRLRSEGYNVTYRGSTASTTQWQTNFQYAVQLKPGPQGNKYGGYTPGYYYEGFLAIQRATDISIMQALGVNQPPVALQLQSFPYPPYLNDTFLFIITTQLPFIIMLSFIVIAPTITKDVVLEKEKRQKESMKLMGMKVWLHWLAWFIKFFIFMLISVSIMTGLFHANVGGKKIINYTDPSVTFVFLLLYTTSIIMFSFAISAFFAKASAGAAASGILYLGSYIPMFFIGLSTIYPTLSSGTKAGCSIICNLAMGIGCQIIAAFESTGVGVQWSNINKPSTVDDQFTMLYIFLLLILDIILYGLITWYFDALFPGDFGTPQPFYFPFTKWYWCGRNSNVVDVEMEADDSSYQGEYIEKPPPGGKVGIRIRKLTKQYKSTVRPAVNNLSIDMYEGQITALLGHNGAGKTTTMFMLTGFLPATSGTAYINGLDLTTDLSKIRQNLGLCPQHDILFDTMTVEEHLTFFAHLKGCPHKEVPEEVKNMIQVLHLEDKRKTASKKLSGGMKRKLSVGIALIGGSKFVILDEPTSGMDPEARRQAWDILQSQRAGRTIILSTHFMDEADLLGDRIAIMAEGQLQCYGSSLFLKGKYGIGYHLTVVKNSNHVLDRTVQRIKQYVPEAELESNVGAELAFILPRECSGKFEELFTDLEQNRQELGIDSFGASVTTLEEVFLKVGEICDSSLENQLNKGLASNSQLSQESSTAYDNNGYDNSDSTSKPHSARSMELAIDEEQSYTAAKKSLNGSTANHNGHATSGNNDEHKNPPRSLRTLFLNALNTVFGVRFSRVGGVYFLLQQFRALLVKHVIHTVRNITVTVVQILVPIAFTIVACVIEKYAFKTQTVMPALPLNLSYYSSPVVTFTSYGSDTTYHKPLVDAYVNVSAQFGKPGGVTLKNVSDSNMDDILAGIAKANLDQYNRNYLTAGSVFTTGSPSANASNTSFIGHFNNIALHAIGISLSMIDNAVLQTAVADSTTRIETINHPLPPSLSSQTSSQASQASTVGFTFSYCVSFGMAFLVATFVVFVVNERAVNAKHAQFVTGVKAINFWLSAYLWDALCFLIPSVLIIIVVLAFQTGAYSTKDVIGVVFLDLALYGWSVIPFAYLLSFLFTVASSAYTWTLIINIFTGTVAVLAVYILQIPALETVEIGNALEWVFYVLLPNYCFNRGLQDVYTNYQYQYLCSELDRALPTNMTRSMYCQLIKTVNSTNPCCPDSCGFQCAKSNSNFMGWAAPGVGRSLVFMALQGAIFSVILVFLESDIVQLVKQKLTARESSYPMESAAAKGDGKNEDMELSEYGTLLIEDDDVKAERQRVLETPESELSKTHNVIFRELTKFYNGTFLAVDRLSLAIPSGECFGLLGVNGAGKTTTFKMLTGDETISAGEAYLDSVNVRKSIQRARERVGYCPQFDALIDQMTVRETLWMYARMRGVYEGDISDLIERLIVQLTLEPHADKQAKNLSGGNRRKLSTGVALIGNPSIVFLDEPTTGMDPVARRLLWNTLTAIRESGRTLILTSHSMEECEALCTRIAIMVNGRFQCLGSTQHLKAKFGEGYSLIIKVNPGSTSADDVEDSSSPFRRNRPRSSSVRLQRGQSVASASGGHDNHHATELDVRMRLVMEFVMQKFPGSQLKDKHDGLLHYRVLPLDEPDLTSNEKQSASQQISWAYVFGEIERAKERLHIEDYSVSQTSLEQVFISFARMQRPPQEVKADTFCGCGCLCCACCKKKDDDDDGSN